MKEVLTTTIITTAFSIVVSAITGYISAKRTYSNDVKKANLLERQKLYIKLIEKVEQLLNDQKLIFNSTVFLIPFKEMYIHVEIYASSRVKSILRPLYDEIINRSDKYFELTDTPKVINERESRLEMGYATELELEQEDILYRENNAIPYEYVKKIYDRLINQIRKELKTND